MTIFKKQNKRLKLLLFFTFFLFNNTIANTALAGQSDMCCNVSSQCRMGFVCVGGTADNADESNTNGSGCCEPVIVLRQVCLFHNIIAGAFGGAITALVIISIGIGIAFKGNIDINKLTTFFVGVICIFGSYQVVKLFTGWDHQVCELVDAIGDVPGVCSCNGNMSVDELLGRTINRIDSIDNIQWHH